MSAAVLARDRHVPVRDRQAGPIPAGRAVTAPRRRLLIGRYRGRSPPQGLHRNRGQDSGLKATCSSPACSTTPRRNRSPATTSSARRPVESPLGTAAALTSTPTMAPSRASSARSTSSPCQVRKCTRQGRTRLQPTCLRSSKARGCSCWLDGDPRRTRAGVSRRARSIRARTYRWYIGHRIPTRPPFMAICRHHTAHKSSKDLVSRA